MSDVHVRDARADEMNVVNALTRDAYAEFADVMDSTTWRGFSGAMKALLDNPGAGQCIVAESDGQIVGGVFLFLAGTAAYAEGQALPQPEFRLLSVAPAGRGKGIGRLLVDECIRRARESGATELGLHTSKSFSAAIALYERMGFTRVPERDFFPPGGEVVEGYRLAI